MQNRTPADPAPSVAGSEPSAHAGLLQEIAAARREGRVAAIAAEALPARLETAYALALAGLAPEQVAGWKIGGANPWSQAAFGNDEPFFGALLEGEVFVGAGALALTGLVSPLAEPEVMLELADLPDAGGRARFSRMALGFEIPASVLNAEAKARLTGQVVDRAGAGLLWIGPPRPFEAQALEGLAVRFGKSDESRSEGSVANVIGHPLGAAQAMMKVALRHGAPLRAGQWIATGGLCRALPVGTGDSLVLDSDFGRLTLRFGPA
ncbi:hypothetical protein [Pseudogemmobacter sonorensis]|uniref:hypothetical protein n=1 Tax=Pseudogemmobacter sonorensis TaxID=2989681 RepID=UPI0036AFD64E